MSILENLNFKTEDYEHIQIKTASDLQDLISAINSKTEPKDTQKLYITLENDIDFENQRIDYISKKFKGVFNGQNFKLKNFELNVVSGDSRYGLFASVSGAVIINLTLENVTSVLNDSAGIFIGSIDGSFVANCHILNANVNNSETLNSSQTDFGIFVGVTNATTYCGCSVRNSTAKTYKSCGGFVYTVNYNGSDFIDCCVVDTDITSSATVKTASVSGFHGYSSSGNTSTVFANCYTSVSITTFSKEADSYTSAFCLDGSSSLVMNCYYDSEKTEITHETKAKALMTDDIKTNYAKKLVGFDFDKKWTIDEVTGYPVPIASLEEAFSMSQEVESIEEPVNITVKQNATQPLAKFDHPLWSIGLEGPGSQYFAYEDNKYRLKHYDVANGYMEFYIDFTLEDQKDISFWVQAVGLNEYYGRFDVYLYKEETQIDYQFYSGTYIHKYVRQLEAGSYRLKFCYSCSQNLDDSCSFALFNFENIPLTIKNTYMEYKVDEDEWVKLTVQSPIILPSGNHKLSARLTTGEITSPETCVSYDFVEAVYAGGDGTLENPYLISEPVHLKLLEEQVNVLKLDTKDKHYKLTADISLSQYDNWTPIGVVSSTTINNLKLCSLFRGHFDGDGHTISNLTIDNLSEYCLGLFGAISDESLHGKEAITPTIKNLKIKNANINGRGYIGCLVGKTKFYLNDYTRDINSRLLVDNVHIRNSKITGVVNSFGGVIGGIEYAVTCTNSDVYNVTFDFNPKQTLSSSTKKKISSVGGFSGNHSSANAAISYFTNCHTFKIVINHADAQSGGFAGYLSEAVVTKCSAESEITLYNESSGKSGGFVGGFYSSNYSSSTIKTCCEECSSKVNIKSLDPNWNVSSVGGFIGYSTGNYFKNCQAIGRIGGKAYTGGFAGTISAGTYYTEPLTDIVVSCSIDNPQGDHSTVAPLFGCSTSNDLHLESRCTNVYYDSDVCTITPRSVGNALTTTQLMGEAALENTELDFVSMWEVVQSDYPQLSSILKNSPFIDISVPKGWTTIGEQKQEESLNRLLGMISQNSYDELLTNEKTIIGAINELYDLLNPQEV